MVHCFSLRPGQSVQHKNIVDGLGCVVSPWHGSRITDKRLLLVDGSSYYRTLASLFRYLFFYFLLRVQPINLNKFVSTFLEVQ